jgi:hypothetical protein
VSCSDLAAAAGIPLAGTASRASRWLLLEQRLRWGHDALEDSGLPPAVAAHLAGFPGRVLLLRRSGRPQGPLAAFSATTTEAGGELRRMELERVEDLLEVDPGVDGSPVDGPLVLVCTHARRDACCATYGVPAYNALRPHVSAGLLWRSSHQGGHRFAANVLALPAGIQLGRVEPPAAAEVATLLGDGRIPLRFYRGRSLHAPSVQAADAAVRVALGADRLEDIRLVEHDGNRVRLDTPRGVVEVRVAERAGPALPPSCGKDPGEATILEATVQGFGGGTV